ncbi:MAG: SMC-Scp complex subunit ScpB [Actinomycetota bacterium]
MTDLARTLEAILFVAAEPLPATRLAQVTETPLAVIEATLREMQDAFQGRGIVLREVAGGWRLATNPSEAAFVERFVIAVAQPRLTQAALETLAVVAYKQPVTRGQIASIRGVDPDSAVHTLVSRGLIREVGQDDGPGQATLYGTTTLFLERMGLNGLGELPDIGPLMPEPALADDLEP